MDIFVTLTRRGQFGKYFYAAVFLTLFFICVLEKKISFVPTELRQARGTIVDICRRPVMLNNILLIFSLNYIFNRYIYEILRKAELQ